MAIYFFYGEEDFNIEKEIDKLKKGLDKNFLEMSFKTYDNPKFADLTAILRTQPMMFGKMLVVINCIDYFSKTFEDKEILAQLPRNEGKKLDSRKKFFKLLSKFNAKEFPTIPTYKTAELEDWVKKQAKSKGIKPSPDAVTNLVIQVGNNLRQLDTELDKLKLLAFPSENITADMVKEICISNEDLFAFSDLLMQNEKDKALLEFHKLLDKKHPLEILATLQTMIRRWIILKAKSGELSNYELSRLTGQHEFVVQKTLQKLKRTNLQDLVALKQNLTEAEYRIKSGQALDIEEEVENAILK